jgi:hypothetical protein
MCRRKKSLPPRLKPPLLKAKAREREYEVEWKPSWVTFVTEDLKRPYDKLYPHGSGDGGGGDGNEDGDLQT